MNGTTRKDLRTRADALDAYLLDPGRRKALAELAMQAWRRAQPKIVTESRQTDGSLRLCAAGYCVLTVLPDAQVRVETNPERNPCVSLFRPDLSPNLIDHVVSHVIPHVTAHLPDTLRAEFEATDPFGAYGENDHPGIRNVAYGVVCRRYGPDVPTRVGRALSQALLPHLDREALRLALLAAGRPNTDHYNTALLHRSAAREVLAEAPRLLPLALRLIAAGVVRPVAGRLLSEIKATCLAAGLTPAAWRWLTRQSQPMTRLMSRGLVDECHRSACRTLSHPCPAQAQHDPAYAGAGPGPWCLTEGNIALVNLLAGIGEAVPYSLARLLHRSIPSHPVTLNIALGFPVLPGFLRAASREAWKARRQGRIGSFLQREVLPALDWLDHQIAHRTPLDRNQVRAPWSFWRNHSARWHAEQIATAYQRRGRPVLRWTSALPTTRIGEVTFTPLTSSEQLDQEGIAMHHCVGGYDQRCAEGRCRIFSAHHRGQHVATCEITRGPRGGWLPGQAQGWSNGDPGKAVSAAMKTLAQAYRRAEGTTAQHRAA